LLASDKSFIALSFICEQYLFQMLIKSRIVDTKSFYRYCRTVHLSITLKENEVLTNELKQLYNRRGISYNW